MEYHCYLVDYSTIATNFVLHSQPLGNVLV